MNMQKPDNNQRHAEEYLAAPARLVAALKRLPQEPVFIPPTLDEAVLRAARRHLEKPRPERVAWLRWMPWAAAAAALVLLAALPQLLNRHRARPAGYSALAGGDLNHDGRMDILDAFALARELRQGGPGNPQGDVNSDGVIDERDVGVIAERAVKLEQGGQS